MSGVMYCTWNGSDSIVVLGFVYYVGRFLISDEGNLATAQGWRWRLPRDKWWRLTVTGGNWELGV